MHDNEFGDNCKYIIIDTVVILTISQIGSHDSHLMKSILKNPGIHFSGVRNISNLSNGSLQRNLKRLEDSKLIKVSRELRKTRYFGKEFSNKEIENISLFRRKPIRDIIEILFENEELFFQEIVQKMKKSPSTTSIHLSELIRSNIVKRSLEKNKSVSYQLKNPQQIKKWLKKVKT